MLWVVMLNYFLHHFPLMCLGEVIIGDVLETLKMPFGRQMVHGNTRATYISRKIELCSMWNAGGWDPMFVHVSHGGYRGWSYSSIYEHRTSKQGLIVKQTMYTMDCKLQRPLNE